MGQIVVLIASYADPDLPATIDSLIRQASGSYAVRIAVVEQETEYAGAYEMGATLPAWVDLRFDTVRPGAPLLGVGGARRRAEDIGDAQPSDITFQVDAHSRLLPNWDRALTRILDRLPRRSIITGMLPMAIWLTPPSEVMVTDIETDGDGWPLGKRAYMTDGFAYPSRIVYAGAMAGRTWRHDVPCDPHVVFLGEQPTLAARLWTAGYDLYHARLPLVHGESRPANRPWNRPEWDALDEVSRKRCRAILGQEALADGDPANVHLQGYGMGTVRSFEDWLAYSRLTYGPDAEVDETWGEWKAAS